MDEIIYRERNRSLNIAHTIGMAGILTALEAILIWAYLTRAGNRPIELLPLVVISALLIFFIGLAIGLHFTVTVYRDRLTVKTLGTRTIRLADVTGCELADIRALRQFGGWGVRLTPWRRGYILGGATQGVTLRFADRIPITVSSFDAERLYRAVSGQLAA